MPEWLQTGLALSMAMLAGVGMAAILLVVDHWIEGLSRGAPD